MSLLAITRSRRPGQARVRAALHVLLPLAALAALLASPSPAFADDLPDQSSTPDDIPGEIAVDLSDDLSDSDVDAFSKAFSLPLVPSSVLTARTRILHTKVPDSDVTGWVRKLSGDPRVEHVEPLAWVHASWTPDDPLLGRQWHLERIGAPRAWAWSTGRGVTVAVVDTGVACEDRPPFSRGTDLAQTWCLPGFSIIDSKPGGSDDNGHGTHVAGTIAQSTNNGVGGAGVAFHARLLPVKVLDARGSGTTIQVADGIRFAADSGAHVINLSLGGARASRIMQDAIAYARSKGAVVVAAAGNNGRYVEYPAAFDGVIAVSATDATDALAKFSSRGKQVDLAAPGVQVLQQTICDGGKNRCEQFATLSGTSMASPHVAGAAALLMSAGVTDPVAVERILKDSARLPQGADKNGPLYGAGILDVGAALPSTVLSYALVRLALALVITLWVVRRVRRKHGLCRPWRPGYVLSLLAFGPGLLFFSALIAPRVLLPLDLLARPLAEWDLLVGVSVHRWLPLAHFGIPLALSAVGFGFKRLRPAIAGAAVGTAAYLASLPLLRITASDAKSLVLLSLWALANLLVCVWLAALNLDERDHA